MAQTMYAHVNKYKNKQKNSANKKVPKHPGACHLALPFLSASRTWLGSGSPGLGACCCDGDQVVIKN
jgi:hypothetical protein